MNDVRARVVTKVVHERAARQLALRRVVVVVEPRRSHVGAARTVIPEAARVAHAGAHEMVLHKIPRVIERQLRASAATAALKINNKDSVTLMPWGGGGSRQGART